MINPHDVAKLGFELVTPGFVCVEVLLPSEPSAVMWSMASSPNHTITGQA